MCASATRTSTATAGTARGSVTRVGVKSGSGGASGCGVSRSSAMRRRRGEPASRRTVLITAANGRARIAPTTPRSEPAMRTATIVVNGETSTARR